MSSDGRDAGSVNGEQTLGESPEDMANDVHEEQARVSASRSDQLHGASQACPFTERPAARTSPLAATMLCKISARPLDHKRLSRDGREGAVSDTSGTGTSSTVVTSGDASSKTSPPAIAPRAPRQSPHTQAVRKAPVLPQGMTPELMRQVAKSDVTRMSAEQITVWYSEEDTGEKMQHQVVKVTGKDLLRALHSAPEDMSAWFDPSVEGKEEESLKDGKFEDTLEGLVTTLAEKSGKLTEIQGLKLAPRTNHYKQVWSATWKLVSKGCGQGIVELRCLVRTLLWKLRASVPSGSPDDMVIYADYLRFLLIPSQVHVLAGTAAVKYVSGWLEQALKDHTAVLHDGLHPMMHNIHPSREGRPTEQFLQSLVGILCALSPAGDLRDVSSTSEMGRRLGDVCTVALPVLCSGLPRFRQIRTRCVVSSFLSNLSWHDDNKIQMYQASDEVVPHTMLLWLSDEDMKTLSTVDKHVASARLNIATVVWNLSKGPDNALGLAQPEQFEMLVNILCKDDEEGDVLRRIVSCVQNLASVQRCAPDLTDSIASDPPGLNVLGTLFGLLGRGGAKNMHQSVLGTFANLAYLCVSGDATAESAEHLRKSLKLFLSHFSETNDVVGGLNLDAWESRDRQLKFQCVRFEIARLLWFMIRADLCHGASVDQLMVYISELDVRGASAGTFYENVPRSCLRHHEIVDLLQCVAAGPEARFTHFACRDEDTRSMHTECDRTASSTGGIPSNRTTKKHADTTRTFALWILAHYTERGDDRVHVASHGGLTVLKSALIGPGRLIEVVKAGTGSVRSGAYVNLKLATKALSNLCQAPQNAELAVSAGVLEAVESLYCFAADTSRYQQLEAECIPKRFRDDPDFRKLYLVFQENLWRPVVGEPDWHEDGMVTVCYEVPAGHNERCELSRTISPAEMTRKMFQLRQGQMPHQIDVLTEVAACLSALAMHSSVLKLFASAGWFGHFLELSRTGLIPRATCLSALLDTPVKAYSKRTDVMENVWALISSIILGSETEAATVSDRDQEGGVGHSRDNVDTSATTSHEKSDEVGADNEAKQGEVPSMNTDDCSLLEWNNSIQKSVRQMVQTKMEQALAVRVVDRLVAGADEDAFEDSIVGGGSHAGVKENARADASLLAQNAKMGEHSRGRRRRSSLLMTSGKVYTVSGILSHQLLLAGIITLASSPLGSTDAQWRPIPPAMAAPLVSAQRRLEYFSIGLAGSLSDAVRRNWLDLEGDRRDAKSAVRSFFELCLTHMKVLVAQAEAVSTHATTTSTGGDSAPRESITSVCYTSNRQILTEGSVLSALTRTDIACDVTEDPGGDEHKVQNRKGYAIHPRVAGDYVPTSDATVATVVHSSETTKNSLGPPPQRRDTAVPPRRTTSLDSDGGWSFSVSRLGRPTEAFLLPEEEQVVQMLFRAILSLLSVPETLATVPSTPRRQAVKQTSKRSPTRASSVAVSQAVDRTAGMVDKSGDTDELLNLCWRLSQCGPGDGILNLLLLVISKVLSTMRKIRGNLSLPTGIVRAVAGFLQRPSLRVKHSSLTLLYALATRIDAGTRFHLTRGSRPSQVVACLQSLDSGVRLAAAKLIGVLVRDTLYTKSVVFPETPSTDEDGSSSPSSRRATVDKEMIQRSPPIGWESEVRRTTVSLEHEAGFDMNGDFDIRQRSADGCIPSLLTMARFDKCATEPDAAIAEQEAALLVLEELARTNNLFREAIVIHGGVLVLMQATENCSAKSRRAVAGSLAQLSINPGQRNALKQAGGLLLLLQFQRSSDVDERIHAELALTNFGSDALTIHLVLAKASIVVLKRYFLIDGRSTVGPKLLRPVHDRQLREAAEGLAICAMHKISAAVILSESGLSTLLTMLRVRDFDVQYSCTRALLHLIRHSGEHFSEAIRERDWRAAMIHLAFLVRPIRQRAAFLLQARLRQWHTSRISRMETGSNEPQHKHNLRSHQQRRGQHQPDGRGADFSSSTAPSPLRSQEHAFRAIVEPPILMRNDNGGTSRPNTPVDGDPKEASYHKESCDENRGYVALVLGGDVYELARLASQCLELLGSQSATAINVMLSEDVIESLAAQLHTYEMYRITHRYRRGQPSSKRRRSLSSSCDGDRLEQSSAEEVQKRSAIRLQRQCIASLSRLALNATGPSLLPSRRQTVERSLLFLAVFHSEESVRGDAIISLRRMQSRMCLPHPKTWSLADCLNWLSCIGLDEICVDAEVFFAAGSENAFPRPPDICERGKDLSTAHSLSLAGGNRYLRQTSGANRDSFPKLGTVYAATVTGDHRVEVRDRENLSTLGRKSRGASVTDAPSSSATSGRFRGAAGSFFRDSHRLSCSGFTRGGGLFREQGVGSTSELIEAMPTAGSRLLQITKADLQGDPFHPTQDVADTLLRNIRALRVQAFAASSVLSVQDRTVREKAKYATEPVFLSGSGVGKRDETGSASGEGGPGVSPWQEQRQTLKEIKRILEHHKRSAEGLVITETNEMVGTAASNTVEATDRYGYLFTIRLVCGEVSGDSFLPQPPSVRVEGRTWKTSRLGRPSSPLPATLGLSGTESKYPHESLTPATVDGLAGTLSTVSKGATAVVDSETKHGLNYLGHLDDPVGSHAVEMYRGSVYQQGLLSEVRRVLSQTHNRGLRLELAEGVAAAGVGRNSIGALITTSRPPKKVTLEMSSSVTRRECPDPKGYISTTLDVIQDSTGVSNLFVLDLCDTTNTQDPRNRRTSLITAVVENNEALVGRLLAEGVDVAVRDGQNRTALLHSVIRKHESITHLLLAHHSALVTSRLKATSTHGRRGASRRHMPQTMERKWTNATSTFSGVGSGGNPAAVVDLQAMLDQRDFTGKASLHHAVDDMEERHKVLRALLAAKAQVNIRDATGNSPLHIACQHGHVDIVKTLIKYNANTASRNDQLMTPLHVASLNLRIKIVSILLRENQGAMVHAEDAGGCTALHYACRNLAQPERSTAASVEDLSLIKEGAEEVVQQLLRHGGDLHCLDKSASKPLNFREYFEERRDEIMQAVQYTLEYRALSAQEAIASVCSLPERILARVRGGEYSWRFSFTQARQRLKYHQGRQRFQAGRSIFSSSRVQEAVKEEWVKGGHRRRAVRMLLLFLLYITAFTASSVLDSGRNEPHGFHLTMSLQTVLETGSYLWENNPSSLDTTNAANDVWDWLEGPVLNILAGNQDSSWYDGDKVVDADGWRGLNVLGPARLSQWRTSDSSCQVSGEMGGSSGEYCFTDYCGEGLEGDATCSGASMDTRPFGPALRYQYEEDVHTHTLTGSFGVYGRGAFVENVTQGDRTLALDEIRALEGDAWIDEATRAIALEMALYSISARKYVYVQVLVELPADGGVSSARRTYMTFNAFHSFAGLRRVARGVVGRSWWEELGDEGGKSAGDRLTFVADTTVLILVLVNLVKEGVELRRQGQFYFFSFSNLFDLLLIAGHVTIFGLNAAQSNSFAALELGVINEYVDLRQLVEYEKLERQWVATLLVLVWIKLMDPLQSVFQDFFLLVKMITLMIGKLVKSFMPLMVIIFMAWSFARYTLLGQLRTKNRSMAATFATQYPESLGEFSFDDIDDEDLYRTWRYVFAALFTMVVVVVMLNLLVSLLNDLYEELKNLATADWCKAQATAVYKDARWYSERRRRARPQAIRKSLGHSKQAPTTPGFGWKEFWRGKERQRSTSSEHLSSKAAALARAHLGFAGEEVLAKEACCALDALEMWNRGAAGAEAENACISAPPLDALEELQRLAAENNNAETMQLIKQGVLRLLASIIGTAVAQGGMSRIRNRSGYTSAGEGGEGGRGVFGLPPPGASPASNVPQWSILWNAPGAVRRLCTQLVRWADTWPCSRTKLCCRWEEARYTAVKTARILVERASSIVEPETSSCLQHKQSSAFEGRHSHVSFSPWSRVNVDEASSKAATADITDVDKWSGDTVLRAGGGGHLVTAVLAALAHTIAPPLPGPLSTASQSLWRSAGPTRSMILGFSNGWYGVAQHTEDLLLLLARLVRMGNKTPQDQWGSRGSSFALASEITPMISEVEEALSWPPKLTSLRPQRLPLDGGQTLSFEATAKQCARNCVNGAKDNGIDTDRRVDCRRNTGCSAALRVDTAALTSAPCTNDPSWVQHDAQKAHRPHASSPAVVVLPTQAKTRGGDIAAAIVNPVRGLSEPRRPSLNNQKTPCPPIHTFHRALSDGGSRPVTTPLTTANDSGSGAIDSSKAAAGYLKADQRAVGFVTRSRPGSAAPLIFRERPTPNHLPADGGRVPRKEYEMCGSNFAALLVASWRSHAHSGRRRNSWSEASVNLARNPPESGFQLLVRVALAQLPPSRRGCWVRLLPGCITSRRRPLEPDSGGDGYGSSGVSAGENTAAEMDNYSADEAAPEIEADPVYAGTFMSQRGSPEHLKTLATTIVRDNFLMQIRMVLESDATRLRRENNLSHGPISDGRANAPKTGVWRSPRRGRGSRRASSFGNIASACTIGPEMGAAIARQIATGSPGGPEALVEARMVGPLLRVAAASKASSSNYAGGSSVYHSAVRALLAMVRGCSIGDDTGAPAESDDTERREAQVLAAGYSNTVNADLYDMVSENAAGTPLLSVEEAIELATLFVDIIAEGDEPELHRSERCNDLAERAVIALTRLLRACENRDQELMQLAPEARGPNGGIHRYMLNTIQDHRGYPILREMITENHGDDYRLHLILKEDWIC